MMYTYIDMYRYTYIFGDINLERLRERTEEDDDECKVYINKYKHVYYDVNIYRYVQVNIYRHVQVYIHIWRYASRIQLVKRTEEDDDEREVYIHIWIYGNMYPIHVDIYRLCTGI